MIKHLERMQMLNQLNNLEELQAAVSERIKNLTETKKKYAAEDTRLREALERD